MQYHPVQLARGVGLAAASDETGRLSAKLAGEHRGSATTPSPSPRALQFSARGLNGAVSSKIRIDGY